MSLKVIQRKHKTDYLSPLETQENSLVTNENTTPKKQKTKLNSATLLKKGPKKIGTPLKASKNSSQNSNKLTPKSGKYVKGIYPLHDPLEEMKAKIQRILQESNEKIASLSLQCSQLDIELENSYAQIQDEYAQELDDVYREKCNRINKINEKYDYDLYQLKEYCDLNDTDNVNNAVYNSVKTDKEDELEEVEEDFVMKKAHVQMNFKTKLELKKEENLKKRQELYQGGIFEEIKNKIDEILRDSEEEDSIKNKSGGRKSFKNTNKLN